MRGKHLREHRVHRSRAAQLRRRAPDSLAVPHLMRGSLPTVSPFLPAIICGIGVICDYLIAVIHIATDRDRSDVGHPGEEALVSAI